MPHPEQEHALMIEVARLRKERDEALSREARLAAANKALAADVTRCAGIESALAAARRECEGLRVLLTQAAPFVAWRVEDKRAMDLFARIDAAAPAAEVKVNACQVDLRTDKDRECFDDIVQAATRVLRSEPVTPAPLLPRVLAALEQEASAHDDFDSTYEHAAALALRALAAELRAYIAEMEGKT